MKHLLFASSAALVLMAPPALAQELASPQSRASYAIGLSMGSSLREDGVTLDEQAFLKGIRDALSKAKPALTDDEINNALRQLQSEINDRRVERMVRLSETNRAEGDAFLKANGAKSGVVTTASGLQYQVLTTGTGPKPTASDTVRANYKGTLLDGTVFDASEEHGGPASFPVRGVIPGWTEALQLMNVGSKWRLFVPAELAYGGRGAGEAIGPNATLVFEVELVSIEGK